MPIELPTEDLDRITLTAARELLDDPEEQVRRWKARRANATARPVETGLAQAGGFGPDVFVVVEAYIHVAWDFGCAWWQENHGNVEAGLLDAAIVGALGRAILRGYGPAPTLGQGNLTDEEVRILKEVVAKGVERAIRQSMPRETKPGPPSTSSE